MTAEDTARGEGLTLLVSSMKSNLNLTREEELRPVLWCQTAPSAGAALPERLSINVTCQFFAQYVGGARPIKL